MGASARSRLGADDSPDVMEVGDEWNSGELPAAAAIGRPNVCPRHDGRSGAAATSADPENPSIVESNEEEEDPEAARGE